MKHSSSIAEDSHMFVMTPFLIKCNHPSGDGSS